MDNPDESPAAPANWAVIKMKGPGPPLDAEFKGDQTAEVFAEWDLHMGRCFGSKSAYANSHPGNIFVSNANVFCRPRGKVWWGDLDLAIDKPALEEIAHRLRCRLYVLREHDGRFKSAVMPHAEVLRRAIWQTGGPVRVPGVRRFLRRSGLTLIQAALIINVRPHRLVQPQPPDVALEVSRRLLSCQHAFWWVAKATGHEKWGLWWTSANPQLNGRSPLEVFQLERTLNLRRLLPPGVDLFAYFFICSVGERL